MGNVMEIVYSNTSFAPPSRTELEAWIIDYDLFNNTLSPGGTPGQDILDAFSVRECTYLVETGCMTVQWKECTCTTGNCVTSVELALDELEAALGG